MDFFQLSQSRFRGCLLGLAVGDAIGTSVEFKQFLEQNFIAMLSHLTPGIAEVAKGSFKRKQPPNNQGRGYVVCGMEAALWAFYHSTSFREGVLMAANLGDDADTTAAIYGQLAGAYYGEQGIPEEWQLRLAVVDRIISYTDKLWEAAQQ